MRQKTKTKHLQDEGWKETAGTDSLTEERVETDQYMLSREITREWGTGERVGLLGIRERGGRLQGRWIQNDSS